MQALSTTTLVCDVTLSTADRAAELFVVDASLPDLATLLAGLPVGAEVVLLPPDEDGMAFMEQQLSGRSGLQALHLMTHGAPGRVFVGSATLSAQTLPHHGPALQAVAAALADDGAWLIYGCEVGAGTLGRALVQQLEDATGVRVAAASHKVGAQGLGGQWGLDVGAAPTAARALAVPAWQGVLVPPTAPVFVDLNGDTRAWAGAGGSVFLDLWDGNGVTGVSSVTSSVPTFSH